jgi:DNA invertase Pin-like site-specific DNA recombinase
LDELLRRVEKGLDDYHAVVVWRFDRMARSVQHLLDVLSRLDAAKVAFISMNENVDTSTSTGKFMFNVLGAVAQFERDIISERTRAGLAHVRARGVRLGRPRTGTSRTTLWRRQRGRRQRAESDAESLSEAGKPISATSAAR